MTKSELITSELIERTDYTGEVITYNFTPPRWLFNRAKNTENSKDKRTYAAAGLLRAILDTPIHKRESAAASYQGALSWACDLLLAIRADLPTDKTKQDPYVSSLPSVSAELDCTTNTATETNRPADMAKIVSTIQGESSGILVIGLAHGGVIATADTFLALEGDGHVFYPVRYSAKKRGDTVPILSDSEKVLLQDIAQDKSVVVLDEDRYTGLTIREASEYFAHTLNTQVYGGTPVHANKPHIFQPQLADQYGNILYS